MADVPGGDSTGKSWGRFLQVNSISKYSDLTSLHVQPALHSAFHSKSLGSINIRLGGTNTMSVSFSNIRKTWAGLLVCYTILFVLNLYPYLTTSSFQAIRVMQVAVDAAAIYGLFGYVTRKPIRNLALRLLYFAVAIVIGLRAITAIYFFAPNLHPWEGTVEQYVSFFSLMLVPFILLVATALWFYAMDPQQRGTASRGTTEAESGGGV